MKIIGFSDIITNSSSEVYVIYTKEAINTFKEHINTILSLLGNESTFDDLFEIQYEFTDDAVDCYADDNDGKEPNDDELLEYSLEHDKNLDYGYPFIWDIYIKAKNPENQKLANTFSYLPFLFEHRELY